MNCSKNKVFNAIHSNKTHKTSGRKRKTTASFDQHLLGLSENNPFLSSNNLKKVTGRIIRNRLQEVVSMGRSLGP